MKMNFNFNLGRNYKKQHLSDFFFFRPKIFENGFHFQIVLRMSRSKFCQKNSAEQFCFWKFRWGDFSGAKENQKTGNSFPGLFRGVWFLTWKRTWKIIPCDFIRKLGREKYGREMKEGEMKLISEAGRTVNGSQAMEQEGVRANFLRGTRMVFFSGVWKSLAGCSVFPVKPPKTEIILRKK